MISQEKIRRQKKREDLLLEFAPLEFQKREKKKAYLLRQSQWWKRKLNEVENCYHCKKSLSPSEKTMDHKVPLARWGRSIKSNLVVCCKSCNTSKGSKTLIEWNSSSTSFFLKERKEK